MTSEQESMPVLYLSLAIIYIMRRMQLYLEDELWSVQRLKARQDRTTISDLVPSALREKYLSSASKRWEAMFSAVGLWKDRPDLPGTQTYMRRLRKDSRLKRTVLR
jgi:hypothetical protein